MEPFRLRFLAPLMFVLAASGAAAQQDADRFPSAAMSFLNTEMPEMEKAITERDRDYFEDAMGRMLDFSDAWGYKTRPNPALARYASCSDAVNDYLVVGLCRFKLSTDICSAELKSTFDNNLQRCRDLAARN